MPQAESLARADAAIKSAFANLYALPSDDAGAPMGSWVIDSAATTVTPDQSVWRIVVTKLTDTGRDLDMREIGGSRGTSPAELAEAAAAVLRLEARISKAEAEASLEITITLNPPADAPDPASIGGPKTTPQIPRALTTLRVGGYWIATTDREVGTVSERWSPTTLHVRFLNVAVTAGGNEEMVDRIIKETRWDALATIR